MFAGGQRICTFEPGSKLAGGTDTAKVSYYYHQDHLNSSSALTDWQGTKIEDNLWYPFGRTQTASPQAAFKVSNQFTGQVKDEETGLYYYGARYFDPELGRFTQPDTIIPDLGNPQSYNRYAYCLNNPLKYVDPDGRSAKDVAQGIAKGGDFVWNMGVAVFLTPSPQGASIQQQMVLANIAIENFGSPLQRMGAYEKSAVATELPAQLGGPAQDLMMAVAARPGVSRVATTPEPTRETREAVFPRTTVLGENMEGRVIPFAGRTGNEHIPFGATPAQWNAMTFKERYKLNDGMLRMRINAGDKLVSTGRDPKPDPIRAQKRTEFDLTGSEFLRAESRNVRVNQLPNNVVSGTIHNPKEVKVRALDLE